MIVVTIISVLLALIFPGIKAAREASRRSGCGNHLKQLALGIQDYHDSYSQFPAGAANRVTTAPNPQSLWGRSWLFASFPYLESSRLYNRVDSLEGGTIDFVSPPMRKGLKGAKIRLFLCPSTPLPRSQALSGAELTVSSYAGIMGANPDPTRQVLDDKDRMVPGPYQGRAAANGMLLLNEQRKFEDCTDGLSSTLMVGEVSAWYFDGRNRRNPTPEHR